MSSLHDDVKLASLRTVTLIFQQVHGRLALVVPEHPNHFLSSERGRFDILPDLGKVTTHLNNM